MITSESSAESAVKAIEKGAYDLIIKPIKLPELQVAVDRAIQYKALNGVNIELREIVKTSVNPKNKILGKSPKIIAALDIAKRVAGSSTNIFISGESGTGKEVFAKFIHSESQNKNGPFVAINCSAIPENLLESELFGHAKGSFTGAIDKKLGLFEVAENGTLFLDEIGDLSLSLQAKLLRVLQEKKIKRVGETQYRPINCRIISATHKDLSEEVNEKRFREDLYFRLNVIPILIPPLRDRLEDIIPLAEAFLKRFAVANDSIAKSFSKDSVKFLIENPWRGNVRELENVIERAVVLCGNLEITLEDFLPNSLGLDKNKINIQSENDGVDVFKVKYPHILPHLDVIIQKYIEFAVLKNDGARDKTAKLIGIDRKTLYKWMKPY